MIEILNVRTPEEEKHGLQGEEGCFRLPKNVRQIGTPNEKYRIYMEDYVYTFLHPKTAGAVRQEEEQESENDAEQYENSLKWEKTVSFLIGNVGIQDEKAFFFISGAIRIENVQFIGDVPQFEAGLWENVYKEMKQHFAEDDILGWCVDMKGSLLRLTPEIERVHREHFRDGLKLLYIVDNIEKDEVFYVPTGQIFVPLDGYYVYYEKNTSMQEYMIDFKERQRIRLEQKRIPEDQDSHEKLKMENEAEQIHERRMTPERGVESEMESSDRKEDDKIKAHYRSLLSDFSEKQPTMHFRMTVYTGSMVVILVVCAISITLFNNYRKMKDLESVISVISESATESNRENQKNAVKITSVTQGGEVEGTENSSQIGSSQSGISSQEGITQLEKNQQADATQQTDIQTEDVSQPADASQTDATQPADNQSADVTQPVDTSQTDTQSGATQPADTQQPTAEVPQSEAEICKAQGYYIAQAGDSLNSISQKIYGTKDMAASISTLNGIENRDLIYAGQKLILP